MEQVWRIAFIGVIMYSFWATSYAQKKAVSVAELPSKAKDFLMEHYERVQVSSVTSEIKSWFAKDAFQVKLRDGKSIEFDELGNWKELDGKRAALPLAIVPEKVRIYLARSFPKNFVVRMRRDDDKYLVAISNGLELEFNRKGKFIKINH
ncbi:PepSY-like domain-containing protein [Sphingobacterium corticis]|uniref:PepSY-like domain-containing protein n=1 Tax=Sphingobacterium corticis TaxID=1812823 RepID=A0ABW5NHJ6_9SPHI